MLNLRKFLADVQACLGFPYVSPGSNDERGIDCSGLLVRAYKMQGAKIYHGSNTIYRQYCSRKGPIGSVNDLQPGYAVFKWNPNTPAKFNDTLGDMQHIGVVVSVSPLRIIHASSVAGKAVEDTKLSTWKYWGRLKDVDYELTDGQTDSSIDTDNEKSAGYEDAEDEG